MSPQAEPKRLPPYVSFKTFSTLLEDLRTHGLPNKVDSDALSRFNGSNRTQLMTALRFLGLVNQTDQPTDTLRGLVKAADEAQQREALKGILQAAYKPIMTLNLTATTPRELGNAFKSNYDANDSVLKKCLTFFLHAAKRADVQLSKRVLDKSRMRPAGGVKRKAANGAGKSELPPRKEVRPRPQETAWTEALLAKFPSFDPAWPDEVKLKWFDAFDRLMKGGSEREGERS